MREKYVRFDGRLHAVVAHQVLERRSQVLSVVDSGVGPAVGVGTRPVMSTVLLVVD